MPHQEEICDQRLWQRLCRREKNEKSFYAVLSTGIYCRFGCPSPRPKPENLRLFDTTEAAERAGFRPCKRCTPDQHSESQQASAVDRACREIIAAVQSGESSPDLRQLAERAGLSPGYFQRRFKQRIGLSPKQFSLALRKERLQNLLPRSSTVTEALHSAGFESASTAYARVKAGNIPLKKLKKGAENEQLIYASTSTTLGIFVMVASRKGLCLAEFCEEKSVSQHLRHRFPNASFEEDARGLADYISWAYALIEGEVKKSNPDLPLDIRGTVFQQKVWSALRNIPAGDTRSYTALAKEIGKPKAVRALASACAQNPMAVIVPCHRVVRQNGDLAGYRWGKERKAALLKREQKEGTGE